MYRAGNRWTSQWRRYIVQILQPDLWGYIAPLIWHSHQSLTVINIIGELDMNASFFSTVYCTLPPRPMTK